MKNTGNAKDFTELNLDEIARLGAKKLLTQALELEVEEVIESQVHSKDEKGHRLVVRNGRGKNRKVTVGSGTLDIRAPRVKDRRPNESYASKILPPYLRKSPEVASILPLLYLKGLSGNAFESSLKMLLGEGVSGLSKSSIASLKKSWVEELEEWKGRKIKKKFVYLWADGVNIKIRLGEDKRLCLLVVIGVTEEGDKRLLAVEGGYRESQESWKLLFQSLIERGLKTPSTYYWRWRLRSLVRNSRNRRVQESKRAALLGA